MTLESVWVCEGECARVEVKENEYYRHNKKKYYRSVQCPFSFKNLMLRLKLNIKFQILFRKVPKPKNLPTNRWEKIVIVL